MQMCDRSRLLRRLAAEDFAVYEAVLYLDAHPDCRRAIAYHAKHEALAARLRAEYEQKYGPLTSNASACAEHWQWIDGPWPWEKEGN